MSICFTNVNTHFWFSLVCSLCSAGFILGLIFLQTYDFLDNNQHFNQKEKFFCFFSISRVVHWRERNKRRFTTSWDSPTTIKASIIHAIRAKTKYWNFRDQIKGRFLEVFWVNAFRAQYEWLIFMFLPSLDTMGVLLRINSLFLLTPASLGMLASRQHLNFVICWNSLSSYFWNGPTIFWF